MWHRVGVILVLLLPLFSATVCGPTGSCAEEPDETSLVQVRQSVLHGSRRAEDPAASAQVGSPAVAEVQLGATTAKSEQQQIPDVLRAAASAALQNLADARYGTTGQTNPQAAAGNSGDYSRPQAIELGADDAKSSAQQFPQMMVPMQAAMPVVEETALPMVEQNAYVVPSNLPLGTGNDQYQYQQSYHSQVSGATPESPEKAARRAADNERIAERAMKEAVYTAQEEEKAAMYAAKKASSLRAAAERAAAAETAAAQSEIAAADSAENAAARKAAAERTHAKVAAVKAVMQKAAAYQASANQQAAAQRAAAARTAAETAKSGLHHYGDEDFDDRFDPITGRAPPRGRERYHRDSDREEDRLFGRRSGGYGYRDADEEIAPWKRERGQRAPSGFRGRTCRRFQCKGSLRQILQPGRVRCDHHRGGCTSEHCCLKASCSGYTCNAPKSLRLQPEGLICDGEGCTEDKCCLTGAPAPTVYSCRVGDAVTATFSGDGRQYRAQIAQMNGGPTMMVTWMDGDTSNPNVQSAQVFKDGVSCASTGSQGGVQVTSDGTQTRPHCSWQESCTWDQSTKENCARKLCQAAGYADGAYKSSSNNMCTTSYTDLPFHYYSVDTHEYSSTSTGDGNEAQITATCAQSVQPGMPVQPLAGGGGMPAAMMAGQMPGVMPGMMPGATMAGGMPGTIGGGMMMPGAINYGQPGMA